MRTNMAVVATAMTLGERLMAFDTVDALYPEQRQAALKAKVAAGFPALNTLKANVSASDAVYIDRVTIAFAAALVHHTLASNKHPCLQLITNKHLPKLLVAVAKGHSSSKRNGTLLLKPYQHGSSVIEEFVQARIRTDKGRRNWNVGGLQLTRADPPHTHKYERQSHRCHGLLLHDPTGTGSCWSLGAAIRHRRVVATILLRP
jgi:hypothetical protein